MTERGLEDRFAEALRRWRHGQIRPLWADASQGLKDQWLREVFVLLRLMKSLNLRVSIAPPPPASGLERLHFRYPTIPALKQILAAARSLERGEENPVECAQDIQRVAAAALAGRDVPSIFAPGTPLAARALGVTRLADNPRAALVLFGQAPSDEDLRRLHDLLAGRGTS